MSRQINYNPSLTLQAFHNAVAFVKAIAGPPGSGKTVGVLWECIMRAMRQPPGADGVRRRRLMVIRESYPALSTTTVKTFKDWVPPEWGHVAMKQPIEGTFEWMLKDGTKVHWEVIFIAIGGENVVDKLRSLEVSDAWLTEATEVTRDVYEMAVQRVGRYPSAKDGVPCFEPGVLLDFNKPGTNHWLYDLCVENQPEDFAYFEQPPAVICTNFDKAEAGEEPPQYEMNPEAENLDNLPAGYYAQQLSNMRDWSKIKSFLLMKWSSFGNGKRVFSEFSRQYHVASVNTSPLLDEPVYVGLDTSGLNPGATFGQFQMGSLVILDELVGDDTPFLEFIESGLKPLIRAKYAGYPLLCICDPSNPRDAFTGQTAVQLLNRNGIKAQCAPTNSFVPRKNAVSYYLSKRAGMVIDPRCKRLIEGLDEGYVYKRLRIGGSVGAQYSNSPDKNEYSHVVDALQYLCSFFQLPTKPDELLWRDDFKGRLRARRLI